MHKTLLGRRCFTHLCKALVTPPRRLYTTTTTVATQSNVPLYETQSKIFAIPQNTQTLNAKISELCKNNVDDAIDLLEKSFKKGVSPDASTFVPLLNAIARNENTQQLEAWLRAMETRYKTKPEQFHKNILLSALCKESLEKGFNYFEQMKEKNASSYNIILGAYLHNLKAGEDMLTKAKELFDGMIAKSIIPTAYNFLLILSAYAEIGKIEQVEKLYELRHKLKFPQDSTVEAILVTAYCKVGDIEKAKERLSKANLSAYNNILQTLLANKQLDDAVSIFTSMTGEIKPNIVTLNTMLNGYIKNEQPERARDLYYHMPKKYGVRPNGATKSIMYTISRKKEETVLDLTSLNREISNLCERGNVEDALAKLEMFIAQGSTPDEYTFAPILNYYASTSSDSARQFLTEMREKYNFEPTIVHKNKVLSALCKEDIQEARKYYDSFAEKDVYTNSEMISGYSKNNMLGEATTLVKSLIPSLENVDSGLLSSVISTYANAGNKEKALELDALLSEHGLKPDLVTQNAILKLHCKAATMKKAKAYFDSMDKHDVVSYNTLLKGYSDRVKRDEEEMAKEVESVFEQLQRTSIRPTQQTFVSLLTVYGSTQTPAKMNKVFDLMDEYEIQRNEFLDCAVMKAYMNAGRVEEAMAQFEDSRKTAIEYNIIIDGLLRAGRTEKAKSLFEKMSTEGVRPDIATMNSLVTGFLRARRPDIVVGIIREMETKYKVKPDMITLNALLEFTCSTDLEQGITMFNVMQKRNSNSYTIIINAILSSNSKHEPEKYLEKMNKEGVAPQSALVNVLVNWAVRESVSDVVLTFIREATSKHGVEFNNRTKTAILSAYVRNGKMNAALEQFRSIKNPNVMAFTALLDGYLAKKDKTKANELLAKMKREGVEPDLVLQRRIYDAGLTYSK